MALASAEVKQLIQQLEADRQAYLSSHNKLQESLIRILANQAEKESGPIEGNSSLPAGLSPLLRPSQYDIDSLGAQPGYIPSAVHVDPPAPKKPTSITSRKTAPSTLFEAGSRKVNSIYSAEESSDSEEGETFFAQNPLPTESFTESQLRDHIQNHKWDEFSSLILRDLRRSGKLYGRDSIFDLDANEDCHDANHTQADIYEVGDDGAPLQRTRVDSKHGDMDTWEVLSSTNTDKMRKQAVGRIVILREPTPLLFAAAHLTLGKHFDMDSIYKLLVDDKISTKAYTKGHLMPDPRRQRSIVFSFKYHTLVSKGREPLHFQNHDPDIKDKDDHIPLSTCSSIVALSMTGKPIRSYRRHSRRSKAPETSHVYDAFAPWHVLSLQCFPDWESEENLHETHHHYVNGADAFLVTLLNEYKDAGKRFRLLTRRIAKLATPVKEIIFNSDLRDDLLFETGDFVWSRRYFWASQTLGILGDEIDAMIQAYKETFTEEVWLGEHKYLFPGTADTSARYSNWRKKMAHRRKLFEREIENLKDLRSFCDREQKDLKGLREWLFSGTSVKESRKAVEQAAITVIQGYNIKLLTLVTIFFLPLTFVTSVFGMTNMNPNESFVHFGISAVTICLPTYFLIVVINSPDDFKRAVAYLAWPFVRSIAMIRRSSDWAYKYRDKYMRRQKEEEKPRTMTRAQTFASLQHRLSLERSAERVPQLAQRIVEKQADSDNDIPGLPHRDSTIKWDMPPSQPKSVHLQEPSPHMSVPELERTTSEPLLLQQAVETRRNRSQSVPTRSFLRRLSSRMSNENPKEKSPPV